MNDLIRELTDVVGEDRILWRPQDVIVYESDATSDRGLPAVVVLPGSAEEVEAIVRIAARYGMSVIPRGAGTGLSGGAVPDTPGILVGTANLRKLLEIDTENRYAIVEPGMVNAELSLLVAPYGMYYAPDPSSQKACTIGGNVNENSGGPHCLLYGMTTNHILGLEIVTVDGERLWVGGPAPDAPGYDLTGMLVGAEGTLAVVTKVMVRLLPLPEATRTFLGVFSTLEASGAAVSAIIAAGLVPAALEIMDRTTVRAVEAAVHAGYPEDAGAVLLIELDGRPEELDELEATVVAICREAGAADVLVATAKEERDRLWAGRKGALGALGRIAPNYFIQDGVVPRTRLQEMVRFVEEVAERYGVVIANVFHAGDGNLHPCIVYDAREPGMTEKVRQAGAEILRACTEAGGSITGEHGVGLDKQDYMSWIFTPEELEVMARLKRSFDPDGRLNPGKVFPGAKGCGEIQGVNQRLALAAMV